jgi:hypothetical protein
MKQAALVVSQDEPGVPAVAQTGLQLARPITALRRANRHWAWRDVVFPLLATRLALVFVGWFAQYFPAGSQYPLPEAARRGWQYLAFRPLDMWARWDTGWHISIARTGYVVPQGGTAEMGNLAFFPLYPFLMRLVALPFGASLMTPERLALIGMLLSNLFLLIAMLLLHRLVVTLLDDRDTARRSVLVMLVFPTAVFLSAVYAEAPFRMVSLAACYAASRRRWALAGLLGALTALTRPLGALIVIPLLWQALESVGWRPARLRWQMLWLVLVPVGLMIHLVAMAQLTGDFLAPLQIQQAWNRELALPWQSILDPQITKSYLIRIEQGLVVGALVLAVMSLKFLPSASYGIYALLLVLPPLFTGTLVSMPRYIVVVFPLFIVLAQLGRHRLFQQALLLAFWTVQVLLVAAWSQFYWVA